MRSISILLKVLPVCLIILAGVVLPAADARALDFWPFGDHGINYTIRIEGADKDAADWFGKLKLDQKTQDHPPGTLDELDQEGVRRSAQLRQALAAKGYFDALVEYHLNKTEPPELYFKITPE